MGTSAKKLTFFFGGGSRLIARGPGGKRLNMGKFDPMGCAIEAVNEPCGFGPRAEIFIGLVDAPRLLLNRLPV